MGDENEAVLLRKRSAELTYQRDQSWALVTAIRSAMDQYDGALKDRRSADVAALIAIERIQDAFATFQNQGNLDVAGTSSPSAPGPEAIELDDLRSKVTDLAKAWNALFYPGNMTGGAAWRAGGDVDKRAGDKGGVSNT